MNRKYRVMNFLPVHSLFVMISITLIFGCGGGGGGNSSGPGTATARYNYTTTVKTVTSQNISSSSGGVINVSDNTSLIYGVKLTIPPNALSSNTLINVGEVTNPPALPAGRTFITVPIDLGPDGLSLVNPIALEIPYTDEQLSNAGASDDTDLKIYYYDKSNNSWFAADITSIDTVNNKIYANIQHFSYYAITGMGATAPDDLGTPRPGDLLFKSGSPFLEIMAYGWMPGHVGIYTGEKQYQGNVGLCLNCSEEVKKYGKYNVVEACDNGVQYSYYDLPNVVETHDGALDPRGFARGDIYMGAREPLNITLTDQERIDIVAFVEAQIDIPYAWTQTYGVLFGMLKGSMVKGPLYYNCVGLAEAAYEHAGINGGEGLVDDFSEGNLGVSPLLLFADVLTPAEMYNRTKPAGGILPLPAITQATVTPNSGTPCTSVRVEITVSHPEGLSAISSVVYVTDSGYTNPDIFINDQGLQGDILAGDGTYSTVANAGGDAADGFIGINITVTDIYGKTDKVQLIYTYTGICIASPFMETDIYKTSIGINN